MTVPAWAGVLPIQTKLTINQPGDVYEQEADQVAEQVMRMAEPSVQRTCACGGSAGADGECATCKVRRLELQRKADGAANGEAPASVHETLSRPGQPLDAGTRTFMESRFGADFGGVRVHTNLRAVQSAADVSARAYTVGQNVVFGTGQYAPGTPSGATLLAHELTHVLQGRSARKPQGDLRLILRDTDPTAAATYPTTSERSQIQEIFNPQQQQATQTGAAVPAVSDPAGFQADMLARMSSHIDRVLPGAQRIQASGITLGMPEIQGLSDIAQAEVNNFYGTSLTAAVHSPAEQAARVSYQLRDHVHEIPAILSAQTDLTARAWVASRMHAEGADLLDSYHVLSGNGARDEGLFESVRDFIFTNRTADLHTIILFFPGYESGGEAYIQPRLVAAAGEAPNETRRRGRWKTLGTTIHEMLHAVAHENFRSAVANLEESGIAVEGFAEYFTRPVYDRLVTRAVSEAALRSSIEGVAGPFLRPPDRTGYTRYFQAVERLREIIGGNEENLKVAFFMGRIEYLGLGGWNEAEAARQRFSANTLGAAALLTDTGHGYFRVQYTHVMMGRGGAFQIHLGGTLSYLTQDQRLGLGGSTYLQYAWPNVYIRGGLDVTGSTVLGSPIGQSVRLDLIPNVEAGVRLGIFQVGAGVHLLVPVAGGPISDRTIRLAAGLGVSVSF